MASRTSRPALRSVESIVVADAKHGKVLVLRDTQGVTEAHAAIPPALIPIVARFDGGRTCEQIAREASRELGEDVPVDLVVQLADELERGLFLEGARFRDALAKVERDFASALVRPASHAGGAYHGDAGELRRYLEEECLDAASPPNGKRAKGGEARGGRKSAPRGTKEKREKASGPLVALIAPHIDPWRGAVGYGHAYGAMRDALEAQRVDTFILLGTSHAPMRQPFALCRKGFATPLGTLPADLEAIDALAESARAAGFDPYEDQLNHKREHSLEFQVVFLKHLLGERGEAPDGSRGRVRDAKIIPILAGLGEHQSRATDPSTDGGVERFLTSLRALLASRGERAVIVAGADLAHIGPRFGDPRPDAGQLAALDVTDRASLTRAVAPEARAFWDHVVRDLDTRRVCGLAPIYTLLRALPSGARGDVLHYEQTVDKDDGSVVSHAAIRYTGN